MSVSFVCIQTHQSGKKKSDECTWLDLIGIYSQADSKIQVTVSHPQWTALTLWKRDVNLSCDQKDIREQIRIHSAFKDLNVLYKV